MVSGKKRNQSRQAKPSWAGGTSLDGRGGGFDRSHRAPPPPPPPQPTGQLLYQKGKLVHDIETSTSEKEASNLTVRAIATFAH